MSIELKQRLHDAIEDDEIIWDAVQTHVPKLLPILLAKLAIIPQ